MRIRSCPRYCFLTLFLLAFLFSGFKKIIAANSLNDPFVSDQWGWYRIGADKAYESGIRGSGVVVAVLDTGVDMDHSDLAANIIEGWNFVDNNDNVTDLDGHGTMVCGIIAAVANNSVGIAGVSPNVSIMPLKVLSSSGGSWIDLNLAIRHAADNGADILIMSLGGQYSLLSTATEAAISYAYQNDCILIAAAGNDNSSEPFYPAAYEQVMAVSAINPNSTKAEFSNFGSYIELCAPGVDIITTQRDASYASGTGTSFAAPFVAGVAALVLSKYPQLNNEHVIETLRAYAEDLGKEGWDQYYGWGLVDAAAVSQEPIPDLSLLSMVLTLLASMIAIVLSKKSLNSFTP